MIKKLLIAAEMTILSVTGISGKTENQPLDKTMPVDKKKTIVAFGDSTTAPRGNVKIYSMRLAKKLPGYKIVNSGVPGNTTRMAKARFKKDVLAHQPDIVIIQFGINDSTIDVWKNPPATGSRVLLSEYEENLKYFISRLKENNCRIILMTPNPMRWTKKLKEMYGKPPYDPDNELGFNVMLDKYVAMMKKVAKNEKVTLLDINRAYYDYARNNAIKLDDMFLDGMHPNNTGHKLVAEKLLKEL